MSDPTTIAVYDASVAAYTERTKDLYERPQLKAFAAALPEGGRVLDLGCGPGLYAAWLAQHGFQVDAIDASGEMVKQAAKQPGVTAWQARFDQILGEALYDGVWANFSLLHAPRADFPGHLAALKRALKPGAILHLGLKLGSGEGADKLGRFYTYYSEDALIDHLTDAGFTPIDVTLGDAPGMAGNIEPYIMVLSHG